jgi:hypothetical protein
MNLDCVNARFAVKAKSYCFTMTLMTVIKAHSVGIILRNVVDVVRMFRGLIKTKRLPLGTGGRTMKKQVEGMAKAIFETGEAIEENDLVYASLHGADADSETKFMRIARHLYRNGYRKASDVIAEVLEILSELKEDYLADDDVREACAISYAEIKIVALKQKYESEGADDDL